MKKEDFKDPARLAWCVNHKLDWLWRRLTHNPGQACYEINKLPDCPFRPDWTATDSPEYKVPPPPPKR